MFNDMFKNTNLLQKALDTSWSANKAITNNIANADTPGYKRQRVDFEGFLSEAINNNSVRSSVTNDKHIPIGNNYKKAGITRDYSTSMREDGNNVDIESEMSQLAKNNIIYNTLIQKISGEFNKLRSAINGGR